MTKIQINDVVRDMTAKEQAEKRRREKLKREAEAKRRKKLAEEQEKLITGPLGNPGK